MSGDNWIPIILFLVIGFIIVSFFYLSHKNKMGVMKTIQKAIDSDTNLTPELLEKLSTTKAAQAPRVKDLRRGIIIAAIGIAAMSASFIFSDADAREAFRIMSLFPLFVGAGFLTVWKLNRYDD